MQLEVLPIIALCACAASTPSKTAPKPPAKSGALATLQREAVLLGKLYQTPIAKAFLAAAARLEPVPTRVLYHPKDKSVYYTKDQRPEGVELVEKKINEAYYYNTRYGSPLTYTRLLELLYERGVRDFKNQRLLDFGYGYIGHLKLLALLGADARGVEVDPLLAALYSHPGDQGAQGKGRVELYHGRFPADANVVSAIGTGYELIFSKNVLKRGYIHPERPAKPKHLIDLGVEDQAFLGAMYNALAPGGVLMIYNLSPAQAPLDKPFIPWADGRSPFSEAQWKEAGFEVLVFDKNDDAAARAVGRTLGWDQGEDGQPGMDLEKGLFALYTIVRKPKGP